MRERWLAVVAAALAAGRRTACEMEVHHTRSWVCLLNDVRM